MEQTALVVSPIYIGEAQGEGKTYKYMFLNKTDLSKSYDIVCPKAESYNNVCLRVVAHQGL